MLHYKGGVRNRRIRALRRLEEQLPKAVTQFDDMLREGAKKNLTEPQKGILAKQMAEQGNQIDRINKEIETLKTRI